MARTYTPSQVSELLNISIRVLQMKLKALKVQKKANRYIITDDVLKALKELETQETNENERITETFSAAEYKRFTEVVNEYPVLIERLKNYQNQIEYLKNSLDKQQEQTMLLIQTMQKSLQTIEQRNFIEANEKNKS
jgi:hypothetical protein